MNQEDPWSDEPGSPRPPANWGCAVAAIIGAVAAVVALVYVVIIIKAALG